MAVDRFYAKPPQAVDGTTAFAVDVNSISDEAYVGFTEVAAELDGQISAVKIWTDLAQDWAEADEDTPVTVGSYSALHWAAKSEASATEAANTAAQVAADLAATNQDVIDTAANLAATNQDVIDTAANLVATNQDVIDTAANLAATNQDTIDTAADRVQTGLDVIATAADRVQTGLDTDATAADRVQTGLDVIATAADRVQTGLDVAATAADRVQTGLDVTAAAASAAEAATFEPSMYLPKVQSAYNQIADASLGTGTHTFDYSAGDMQQLTLTGDITIAFSNFVTGKVCTMIIDLINGGDWTITYPAGILFSGGTEPNLTSGGTDRVLVIKDKDDVYSFFVVGTNIGAVA